MTASDPHFLQRVAESLGGARQQGDGWMCKCPCHHDDKPSLSLDVKGGRFVVHCFAGCDQDRVAGELKNRSLWPDPEPKEERRISSRHEYRDEDGVVLFEVVRYADGKAPKALTRHLERGRWAWGAKNPDGSKIRRVLYRLPEVLQAKTIWLCEGEKDADALVKLGLCATTSPFGANAKWLAEYTESLKGKKVYCLPDNDEPGREHMNLAAYCLAKARISAKVIELPGQSEKDDVRDWLKRGGDRHQLIALARAAPWWKPRFQKEPERKTAPSRLEMVWASEITLRPVSWLWQGRIARGKLTVIAGDPGLAKSTIAVSMAGIITGPDGRFGRKHWPDGTRCRASGSVVFLSAEDDAEDTLGPRLEAAGADRSKVAIIKTVFSLERDLEELEKKLKEVGDAVMVVIDPISAYIDGIDSHKNSEVRGVMARLKTLASKYNLAIVLITHVTKDGARAMMSVSGSLAFVAAARTVHLVTEDPQDSKRRLVCAIKNNLGPPARGLAYFVEGATVQGIDTSEIVWDEDGTELTAQEAFARARTAGQSLNEKEQQVIELMASEGRKKPNEIARKKGWNLSTTRSLLKRMKVKKAVVSKGAAYDLKR